MTATRLANVGTGDPQPLALGRRGEHVAQKLAIALLQLVAPAQRNASVRDPLGKGVSNALQLAEIGDPRRSGQSRNPGIYRKPWERLSRKVAQLPLEAPELAPQLGPGQPLAANSKRRDRLRLDHLSCEQVRHLS